MGNSLQYPCNNCGRRTPHPVVKTHTPTYRWSDRHTAMFKAIFGRDVLYRSRSRQCDVCGDINDLVEMRRDNLAALIGEVDRLNGLLDRHIDQQGVAWSPYFPGVVEMLREVVGERQWHYDPRLTWQQADEILQGVSGWLSEIEPELADFVRYRYKLWDAPRPERLSAELTTRDALSKLRHPSRSRGIVEFWNVLWPIEAYDADDE